MPRYSNGFIPDSALVTLATGYNSTDGTWTHKLTRHTAYCWDRLRKIAHGRTGRWLEITEGFGAYRPYYAQVIARRIYGYGAAYPGTSSHGGHWEDQDTMAIDVGNWEWVYAKFGNRARAEFFADVRKVGMLPGMIHPSRGNSYPDEPWHIIDPNPYAAVPSGGGSAQKPKPNKPAKPGDQDENMKVIFGHRNEGGDEWMIIHPTFKNPKDANQRGYIVTTSKAVAVAWGRMYKNGAGSYDFNVDRQGYIDIQAAARLAYDSTVR